MSYGGGGYGDRQQQQNPYAQQSSYNPYDAPPQSQGGYGGPQGGYEMGNLNGGAMDMNEFYDEVDSIRQGIEQFQRNVQQISSLHQTYIQDIDANRSAQTQHQMDSLTASVSQHNRELAQRIKSLKGKASRDQSMSPQVNVLDRNFKDALRQYQQVEKRRAESTRDRMEREYRIVRPDASDEEVRAACEDSQGQQIFSQALLQGNRRGEARSALREVQNRHNEIQKIEKTIIELAQLFQEMEQLVAEQEPMVQQIDQQGEEVVNNVEQANKEIEGAVEKARSRRRKKWWCLLIVLLIIIAIIVIALVVTKTTGVW